jgi:hypothetical protein
MTSKRERQENQHRILDSPPRTIFSLLIPLYYFITLLHIFLLSTTVYRVDVLPKTLPWGQLL